VKALHDLQATVRPENCPAIFTIVNTSLKTDEGMVTVQAYRLRTGDEREQKTRSCSNGDEVQCSSAITIRSNPAHHNTAVL